MSGKISDNTFFFTDYGCCIPTESYAWILVALFITAIVVLLVCILATAIIRWMYKRRMRKRLHDLKRKFLIDQLNAQEFEAKLHYMAQKNKSGKNEDFSKEGGNEKLTIVVDPNQNFSKQNEQQQQKSLKKKSIGHTLAHKATAPHAMNAPIYDQDETPIAQSSLASQSKGMLDLEESQSSENAKARNEHRWFHLQKNQNAKPPPDDTHLETQTPTTNSTIPTSTVAVHESSVPSSHAAPEHVAGPLIPPALRKSPPLQSSGSALGDSSTVPQNSEDVFSKVLKNLLEPPAPTSTTTPSSFDPTSNSSVTKPSANSDNKAESETSTPTTGATTEQTEHSDTTPPPRVVSDALTSPVQPTVPSTLPKNIKSPPKPLLPPNNNSKPNIGNGLNEIVSPVKPGIASKGSDLESEKGSENPTENRGKAAGGRTEWKFCYASGLDRRNRKAQSSTTKSSASHRRTTESWLFDSTGTSRFGSSSTGEKGTSATSSSILKTDSSRYKTASVEQFPHGAFEFY